MRAAKVGEPHMTQCKIPRDEDWYRFEPYSRSKAEPNTDGQPSDCPILGFVPCLAGPQGILVD